MYTLIRAIALSNKPASQWETIDASTPLVSLLFRQYRRVVITVTQNTDPAELFIDLEQLRNDYAAYQNKLPILLQTLGDRSLDTLSSLPGGRIGYAKYNDIYRCGYEARLAVRGRVLPEGYPASDMPDIELRRPNYNTELKYIHSHTLASVNGFYHMTDTDGEKAWIVDAGVSARKTGTGYIGLLSFMSIGRLTKTMMLASNFRPINVDDKLKDGIRITLPGTVSGKPGFLVVGGYLVFPEADVFYPVNDTEYILKPGRLPYIERLQESASYIDLSKLGLSKSVQNPTMINIEEAWSDAVLIKYLLLSQSFFVSVDTPILTTRMHELREMQSPGIFTSLQDPEYPLVVGYGRTAEYWKTSFDGVWNVTVADSYMRNYVFTRQSQNTLVNVTDQLACDDPYDHSQGRLLEISRYAP